MSFFRAMAGALAGAVFLVGIGAAGEAPAANPDPAASYTKYEFRIPMRDGVRLFTAVYVPKDASKPYPFLLTRTPYSVAPYGEDQYPKHLGPSPEFDAAGYIFVRQDVRGRWQSDGVWAEMTPHLDRPAPGQTDESLDTYDTVDWLLKHVPNNNGRVGIVGISYPGFYASAGIIDSHPAIKAASPQAPMTDLFMNDDLYHNGAFMLDANFDFYTSFKPQHERQFPPKHEDDFDYGTTDGYDFFLRAGSLATLERKYLARGQNYFTEPIEHSAYDRYWQAHDLSRHLHNIHCAVLNVGGLFDAEDISGPTKTFHAIAAHNPAIPNYLIEGPWVHGGWAKLDGAAIGDVRFATKTAEFFREKIQFPFFEQYLKDAGDAHLPTAYVFETGANVWRKYASWPPAARTMKTLYFQPEGGLAFAPPSGPGPAPYDEYISDPAHPVPPVGYPYGGQVPRDYMVADQRFAAKRPDVLVYQTEPLTEDVTLVGPVMPKLFVSTTGTDSDWVVKLIDVYPADYPNPAGADEKPPTDAPAPKVEMGGYQQLVRGEPMRGKFRRSFERPEPFVPGQVEEVDFSMPDISHTFRAGHRIMVQVQSSWFPLTDRNPQTFTDIPNAQPADFHRATQRVYRFGGQSSGLVVGTLNFR